MKKLNMSRINLEISNKEKALKLTDKILEVLKSCDGKQMTKRIETKLKEVDSHIDLKKDQFGSWDLTYSFWDSRWDEESRSYVFNDELRYFGYYKGETLNFEEVKTQIEKSVDYYTNSIEVLKRQLTEIDSILEKRKELCEKLNKIHDSIHYIIRKDLDLDTHTFFNL